MKSETDSFFSKHSLFVLDHESLDILDVNDTAIQTYGYSRDEFLEMNLRDLGENKMRSELLPTGPDDAGQDRIWIQESKSGETIYVQFTAQMFNYDGRVAKLATAHDVTSLIEQNTSDTTAFPQIQLYNSKQPLAEIIWDNNKRVQKWSDKAVTLFGWERVDVLENPDFFDDFIYEKDLNRAYEVVDENIDAGNRSFTTECRVYTRSGAVCTCEWHNTLVYDQTGSLTSMYSLIQDISDRKESEYLFKALSEESLVGVYLIQDGLFKYVNPRFAQIFNTEKEEIENKLGPLDFTHPEDRQEVADNLKDRIDGTEQSLQYDFRCFTSDKQIIHVKVFGTRIQYLGKPAVAGTLLDITNSKLAHERFEASVESFEDLFDSMSDAIYIQDEDARFIKVNNAAVELNGYDRDFLIGKTPDVLAAPGKVDLEQNKKYFQLALSGKAQRFEQWGERKNGEVFPEEVILNPGTYFGDDVVIAISRDISARHEIEGKIQATEERFKQLFQNSPFGIGMMNAHQEIVMINDAFEDIFGYKEEEILGLNIDRIIIPEEHRESAADLTQVNYKGETFSVTGTRQRKDGSLVEVLVCGVPITIEGKLDAFFGIYMDITERKEAEDKIKKSLKEKEVLLAEIHHRVKNNLAVITGLLELQQYNSDSEEARNILNESQLRINSIALIHEKLYQNENLSEISIDVYLKELIEVIVSSMKSDTTDVSISVDSDSIFLTINHAIPCGLILNELITNSYKHAFIDREDGNIDIKLREEGGKFQLTFKDNGTGMPDDINYENPTSLGLTLIRTLVKQLQGTCRFTNTPEGMKFTMECELEKEENE